MSAPSLACFFTKHKPVTSLDIKHLEQRCSRTDKAQKFYGLEICSRMPLEESANCFLCVHILENVYMQSEKRRVLKPDEIENEGYLNSTVFEMAGKTLLLRKGNDG
jgi:hypothetical protein